MFDSILPGWNSLQIVSMIHSVCEIAGILFLGLMVIAEVGAYKYGHRKEALQELASKEAIRAIEEQLGPRKLTGAQRKTLASLLGKAHKQKVQIVTRLMDGEAAHYAQELGTAFMGAGWTTSFSSTALIPRSGVWVLIPSAVSPGLEVLIDAFNQAGIATESALDFDLQTGDGAQKTPNGWIRLFVGSK